MNTFKFNRKTLVAAGVVAALLAACSASPTKPDGAENLRSRLTQLQSDPRLGSSAPLAMKEADVAVTAAERPQSDKALAAHLIFMADRKIDIAQAEAEGNFAVAERKTLNEEREAMRLQARTREADSANVRAAVAHTDAVIAEADASNQRLAASDARNDADLARDASANAQRNAQELQKQIDELQAKVTDRGLVLTLGDLLFASGTAQLNSGGNSQLVKLAAFLNRYPERTALIEGHTDSIGSEDYNQGLSQRRADAVQSYLVGKGIAISRITASGKGKNSPIADNSSATGRQQNRRVEVIINSHLVASR